MRDKRSLTRVLRSVSFDLLGALLYSVGLISFASVGEFAPGGISGIALILDELFSFPVGLTVLTLNIPLILLSLRVLGWNFLKRTAISGVFCSVFLDLILPGFPTFGGSRLMSALLSGVFIGFGLAVFYLCGSSSGGIDLVLLSLRKRRPKLPLGALMLIFDIPIILSGYFVFGDIYSVFLGAVATSAESLVVELALPLEGRCQRS